VQSQLVTNHQASAIEPIKKPSTLPAEILTAFKKDLSICTSAAKIFKTDSHFLKEYGDAYKRAAEPQEDFLQQALF
jgi:hypothetical protein